MAPNEMIKKSSSYRSQLATLRTLSVWEKINAFWVFGCLLSNMFKASFTWWFRSKNVVSKSWYRFVTLTGARTMTGMAAVRVQQYLALPTDEAYLVYCKKKNVKPRSIILEDGTTAHWVGVEGEEGRVPEKVLVNFHGGGYCLPAAWQMFEFTEQVVVRCRKAGKDVGGLFLSYDLAPGATYPRQLQQAAMLLEHILTTLKIPPQNIIITGDSAGGNLALGLLSHISHPHPSPTIPPISRSTPLKGIVLISPWVDFRTNTESWRQYRLKDCMTPAAGNKWSKAFLGQEGKDGEGGGVGDEYSEAMRAEAGWWNGSKVESVLVVAGGEECLVDGIKEFVGKFKEGFGEDKVKFVVVEGEYHDQPNLDPQFKFGIGDEGEGDQAKVLKAWIEDRF